MLNKALIKPVHRDPTLCDILPRPAGVKYYTLTDARSGHHNLNKRPSYLTTFSCPFCRYRYVTLLCGVAPAGDVFQKKIDGLFSSMSHEYGIAEDILISGFDRQGKDCHETLEKVLWVCRQANLKLNNDKCHFEYPNIPFLMT